MSDVFFLVVLVLSLVPLAGMILVIYLTRKVHQLRKQMAAVERDIAAMKVARPGPVAGPAPVSAPVVDPVSPAAPAPVPPPVPSAAPSPPPSSSPSGLEQLIGGIWLQNVGSVLLLLGSFFLIFWGYTQGKIGPQILILAGAAVGIALAWRGDHIARSIRPLGHALLGVGLGVVYISVYLGHFGMRAIPAGATTVLLALVSFATIDIGLRRSQAIIAALGIFGAFIPFLLGFSEILGFRLPYLQLLGYLLLTNAVVVVLTALRGWSGLVIEALILTSMAWLANAKGVWPLDVQLALSGLFVALGMAPVVRLARSPDPVRGGDLTVVALAPMLLLVTSLPYFASATSVSAGGLLLGLGVVNLAAALMIDAKRSQRDLWRPLTAAAVVFITAALERLLAKEDLALAWCVEGAVLVWLGLGARGGWFRGLGYLVSFLAALRMLFVPGSYDPSESGGGLGIVTGAAIRDLLCVVVLVVTADRMGRRREHLSAGERHTPGLWIVAANTLGAVWLAREAPYVARLLAPLPVATVALTSYSRATALATTAVTALAWAIQATALVALASLRKSAIHRHVGYGVWVLSFGAFLIAVADSDAWRRDDWVAANPTASLLFFALVLFVAAARFVSLQRIADGPGFPPGEGRAPEVLTALANGAILLWTARMAWEFAYRWTPGSPFASSSHDSRAVLTAVVMSAGWMAQAGVLFVMGWRRRAAFYRWLGLSIVALTLLKFTLFDLQRVDVFWRFVVALGIGGALLLVSFAYQRGKRERASG